MLSLQDLFGDSSVTRYLQALLCDNVDPEYRDDEGYTALMFAATSNFLGGVKELVANGADINRASLADG